MIVYLKDWPLFQYSGGYLQLYQSWLRNSVEKRSAAEWNKQFISILYLDLGLVTSCCSRQTACWRPACCWLGWGSMSIGDPSKSHKGGGGVNKNILKHILLIPDWSDSNPRLSGKVKVLLHDRSVGRQRQHSARRGQLRDKKHEIIVRGSLTKQTTGVVADAA